MPRPILDAVDIKQGDRGWTCIVQVIERHPVLHKKLKHYPFQKRYRNYLLTDIKGTKVKAVIFDRDIDFFEQSLQPFKRYKVSNAVVTLPEVKHQLPGYKFSWIITTRAPVEPIVDSKPYTLPCSFEVCKFADLHKYAESDANIPIRALVVHRFPVKDITDIRCAKDYVVVNEEKISIVLRLWKDLLEPYDPDIIPLSNEPVTIIASNLEVRTFHGLSLATRNTTYLLENPPLPIDLDLKKWYAENKEKVVDWVKQKAYENSSKFFAHPKASEILDLPTAMNAFLNVKACWVKAKLKVCVTRVLLYEIVCANCQMIVDAGVDWDVECSGCSVLSPMHIRLKIPVYLYHEDMTVRTILRSPDAEKLCPYSALEIKKHQDGGAEILTELSVEMDNTEVVCFFKHYDRKESYGENAKKFVILKMYTTDEMNPYDKAVNTPPDAAVSLGSASSSTSPAELISSSSPCAQQLEAQFFTPTTQKVLEQIIKEGTNSHLSPAKRAINFGTVTVEDLQDISKDDDSVDLGSTLQTKTKRNKGPKHGP